jgi:hypothetical protein
MFFFVRFHMPAFSGLLVIAVKHQDKCRFCVDAILLFHIVQKDLWQGVFLSIMKIRSLLVGRTQM